MSPIRTISNRDESVFVLALHGGAGVITRSNLSQQDELEYRSSLQCALDAGYSILDDGGSAVDAVEITVRMLENCPLFNAGRGSVFSSEGNIEMDACIMDGRTRKAGAVAAVTGIKNPIQLARAVMDKTNHVLLVGQGAIDFASTYLQKGEYNLPLEYFYTEYRHNQWKQAQRKGVIQVDHTALENKYGTVGCVALDRFGNLAAATSTGGLTNKMAGRVGDSAIIGAGTYANNDTCAVSCTGHGESMIRGVVAYDVHCIQEFKGVTVVEASHEVIHKRFKSLGGEGGLIAVDRYGNFSMPFNTQGMYRAARSSNGYSVVAIFAELDDKGIRIDS